MSCTATHSPDFPDSRHQRIDASPRLSRRCAGRGGAFSQTGVVMGFTKLDENLLQSSIMAEDGFTFKIWISLLAACREDGIARVSPIFLSSVCRIPIEDTIKAIEKLASPDPLSRSTNNEGCRIERVDGGFHLINYQKYRQFTLSGSQVAVRQRKHRQKRDSALHVTKVCDISASASASASASTSESESEQKGNAAENAEFDAFWKLYPRKEGKGNALRAWKKLKSPKETLVLIRGALAWQATSYNWTKDGGQYRPLPASYLNGLRWLDERREWTGPEKGSPVVAPVQHYPEYHAPNISPDERPDQDFLSTLADGVIKKLDTSANARKA